MSVYQLRRTCIHGGVAESEEFFLLGRIFARRKSNAREEGLNDRMHLGEGYERAEGEFRNEGGEGLRLCQLGAFYAYVYFRYLLAYLEMCHQLFRSQDNYCALWGVDRYSLTFAKNLVSHL